MKRFIGILTVFFITGCQQNPTLSPSKFKTLMIKSQGKVETLPDEASFTINLNCIKSSVKLSKNCLVDKTNELQRKLLDFGINEGDILTTAVNMSKKYIWRNSSNVFQGYESTSSIFLTLKDISILDEIYSELLENRNLELYGLAYSHSNIDSLKNEAYVNALKNSETLADKLIRELPEDTKEILKIGNIEITASLPESDPLYKNLDVATEVEVPFAVDKRRQTVAINKGTVHVLATLFVEYQIK